MFLLDRTSSVAFWFGVRSSYGGVHLLRSGYRAYDSLTSYDGPISRSGYRAYDGLTSYDGLITRVRTPSGCCVTERVSVLVDQLGVRVR